MQWYEVTFTAPAQMKVSVLADTPQEALMRAEDGNYEGEGNIEWVKGKSYTTKVRIAPETAAQREP